MVKVGMCEYTGEATGEGGEVFYGRAGYRDSVRRVSSRLGEILDNIRKGKNEYKAL